MRVAVLRELRVRDGFLVVSAVLSCSCFGAAALAPSAARRRQFELSRHQCRVRSRFGIHDHRRAPCSVGLDIAAEVAAVSTACRWNGSAASASVVLAVALLPMLGVGGMQLMRAETPGPIKDSKLTPRITGTAKVLCRHLSRDRPSRAQAAYWLAGMSTFDAIAHSFSTVSTGGNSTHDASIGYFNSVADRRHRDRLHVPRRRELPLHFLAWRHNAAQQLLPRSGISSLHVHPVCSP